MKEGERQGERERDRERGGERQGESGGETEKRWVRRQRHMMGKRDRRERAEREGD